MQWWTDFLDWLNSNVGGRIISTVVIPFVAIVVAGFVAALIGRASARKVIELSEREVRASAVTALISAARKAAVWNTLPAPEQQHIDHLIGDAEIRLRLLPIAGTGLAADWARHEIAGMKRNAISFSFQAEQSLIVFRDRLIEWQGRPGRAKKLFKNDLDSWAYDSSASEQELVHQQQKWAAAQVTETGPIKTVTTSPFSRPPSPPALEAELVESSAQARATATTAAPVAAPAPEPAPIAITDTAPIDSSQQSTPPDHDVEADAPAEAHDHNDDAEQPHPLVEPEDTGPHDVSEASIFAGNPVEESLAAQAEQHPGDGGDQGETPSHSDDHGNDEHHENENEHHNEDENHDREHEYQRDHERQHEEWRG
jgi:hypothetical protein